MAKTAAATYQDDDSLGGRIKSLPQRIRGFYTDVRTEMKKVTTPSRKEVQATTMVVIITVALFGLYFWLIDSAIGFGVNQLFKRFAH